MEGDLMFKWVYSGIEDLAFSLFNRGDRFMIIYMSKRGANVILFNYVINKKMILTSLEDFIKLVESY